MNNRIQMLTKVNANLKKTVAGTMEGSKVQKTTLTMKEASEYLGILYWLTNQIVKKLLFEKQLRKCVIMDLDNLNFVLKIKW